ncbi:cytochrome P450 [Saccharopolyspora shandongensis]|uniref:cytochrome P450 n=1 Tax=Saccharopolyspora shandongensis TaxID=418495 RepID=UPI00342C8D99
MRITAPDSAESVPLDEIDLYAPERYRDGSQHAAWQTLRRQAPVWWHERPGQPGFWSVTRYADCERVLKEHRTFSSASGTVLGSIETGDPAGGRTISLMDPPEHTGLRTASMRSFSHSVLRGRTDRIQEQVRRLVQPCLDGEQDFAHLMRRLPMAITGELIGIPEEHWDPIAFWTAAGISPEDPAFAVGPTTAHTLRRAHHELFARFSELIAHRRRHPGTDLISALLELRPDGRRMEDGDVLLNCYSFMAGANSTTPHVAGQTLLALIEHPSWWEWLREDPERTTAVVEEGVRWTATPHHLVRRAVRDTEISGVRISAGDWVCAWVGSAHRDEAVFDDPYRLDPQRPPNQHMGFGIGPHYCIGAPLSRIALRALFEELVSKFEQIELAGPVTHLTSNWVNGLSSMPVLGKPRR